jgi:acetoin utilization deacetylase AcuC-like enzyme
MKTVYKILYVPNSISYHIPASIARRTPFPMLKYELLPQQLLHEGTALPTDFFEPSPCDLATVLAIHKQDYVNDLLQLTLDEKARKSDFHYPKN